MFLPFNWLATGMTVWGIESLWERDFSCLSSLLYHMYRMFPGGETTCARFFSTHQLLAPRLRMGCTSTSSSSLWTQWHVIGLSFTFTPLFFHHIKKTRRKPLFRLPDSFDVSQTAIFLNIIYCENYFIDY